MRNDRMAEKNKECTSVAELGPAGMGQAETAQNETQPENLSAQAEAAEHDLKLEDLLAQVEQCIGQLENPQISLEDSFRYYEEGIRRLKMCSSKVAQIEQKMLVINSQGELEDF